jgi:hypothetical protein
MNCNNLVEHRWRNTWDNFMMRLVNSAAPVFTNVSINLAFQILGNDKWASRLCLRTFLSFVTPSPHTLTSWRWISAGRMFIAFKNQITECTSKSGLVIDMVLYKAQWHSKQFTRWLGKHWECNRGCDDSSRPSKTCMSRVRKRFLL